MKKHLPHVAAVIFFLVGLYNVFVAQSMRPETVLQQIVQQQQMMFGEMQIVAAFIMECIWWLGEKLSGDSAQKKQTTP